MLLILKIQFLLMLYVAILNKISTGGRDFTITNYFKTF